MKFLIKLLGVVGLLASFGLVACGDKSHDGTPSGLGRNPTPTRGNPAPHTGGNPGATEVNPGEEGIAVTHPGRLLFETPRTDEELAQERADFLTHTYIQETIPQLYSLNSHYVAYRNQAFSPAVFGYVTHTGSVRFTASFPAAFRFNLPQEIQDAISNQNNIEHLDIFFTPQQFDGRGFKPHCWAANDRIQAIPFAGGIYADNLLMGIYQSDADISLDLRLNELRNFGVSIHDDTLSPIQPELNIRAREDIILRNGLSFWSLVIDQRGRRAAATLHWILPSNLNDQISNQLRGRIAGGITLPTLIRNLHAFRGTPIMQRLENLIR